MSGGGPRRHVANVVNLAGGSLGAVLLAAAFLPVIARIFPVEVLGHFHTLLAAAAIAGAVLTLRLEMAIVLAPAEDRPALVAGSLLSSVALTGAGVVLWLLWLAVAPAHALPPGWTPEMAVPFVLVSFATALALVAAQVLLAAGRYGVISRMRILQVLAGNGLMVVAGWWWPTFGVLAVAQLVAALVPVFVARDLLRQASSRPRAAMAPVLHRYRDFMTLNFPANVINTASLQLPTVLIAAWYGPVPAVFFAMANRVLDIPFGTLSGAMSQVFYRESSEHVRGGGTPLGHMRVTLAVSLVLGLAIAGVFLAASGPIVQLVLGDRWGTVAEVIPLVLAWRVMQFVNQPVSTIYSVLRRQEIALLLIALFFVPRLWLLATGGDFLDAVARYTVGSAVFYFCYTLVGYWLATREQRHA